MLEWTPSNDFGFRSSSLRYPTKQTLQVYGYSLCNFLEWCDARKVSVAEVSYTAHLYLGYQAEMLDGRWSSTSRRLSPATVNLRVREALHFIQWAADRELRGSLRTETVLRQARVAPNTRYTGGTAVIAQTRAGTVRPNPINLVMPTDQQVKSWLQSVRIEKGPTKALLCELILRTGLRREEAVEWRVDTLPEQQSAWQITGDYVNVLIKHGAKGPKYVDGHGEEIGPARHIRVPLDLAQRIAHYREYVRPGQRAIYVREAKSSNERRKRLSHVPRQLFLSDATGNPIAAGRLYEAWTTVGKLPFKGWAPHQARHYWACKTLLEALRRPAVTGRLSGSAPALDWVTGAGMSVIQMLIRPQLGHVNVETTNAYLGWAYRALTLTTLQDEYVDSLESIFMEFS